MRTTRQSMIELLMEKECDARDISKSLSIMEKEVYLHLPHIARTAASQKRKLVIIPSECISCDHVFKTRTRYEKPGRCPRCGSGRIREPGYRIV